MGINFQVFILIEVPGNVNIAHAVQLQGIQKREV